MQQAVVKNLNASGEPITQYTIDLQGPILPFHLHRLCKLFQHSQNNSFELTSNTLDHSACLNCVNAGSYDLQYEGKSLSMSETKSLENGVEIKGNAIAINSIVLENGIFKCY